MAQPGAGRAPARGGARRARRRRPSTRSVRFATRPRSMCSVAATSAADVRSTSIASSARSSGSTRCAAASSCVAGERRQRGLAARDEPDRLEQLGAARAALSTMPVGARHAGEQLDLVVGQRRVEDHARARRPRSSAAGTARSRRPSRRWCSSSTTSGRSRASSSCGVGDAGGRADRHQAGLGAQQHARARRELPAGDRRSRRGSRGQPSQGRSIRSKPWIGRAASANVEAVPPRTRSSCAA